ncbi:hypothetical protein [Actinopolyspora alba]|uniref:hypothetical protein n=1 Tax=Actinopolyspora alba TaxID=673379 RepID=UPI001C31296F|nr:hypothetical protein [Actinopolyspora alba]
MYRSIRALNGFRSWEDPPRTLYQLATTTLEVVRDTGTWTLLINGASTDCVQDTVARLGYQPDDVKPHPLPELAGLPEQVQRARLRNAGAA